MSKESARPWRNRADAQAVQVGWLYAEAQVLFERFSHFQLEASPEHLDRYAVADRYDGRTQSPSLGALAAGYATGGLGGAGVMAAAELLNNMLGQPSSFPVQNGVNLDLLSSKWNALSEEDQVRTFEQMRALMVENTAPAREAFIAAGIPIIDDFE